MVHEVVVEDLHGVVMVLGVVACGSRAIRVILATKIVANTDHAMQPSQKPLLISSLNKVTGTITHLPFSFQEAESRTISYVARPHHRRQPHIKHRLQQTFIKQQQQSILAGVAQKEIVRNMSSNMDDVPIKMSNEDHVPRARL